MYIDFRIIGMILAISMAGISLLCSVFTLLLIKLHHRWNGYLQLVVSLTACQAFYDFGFLLLPGYHHVMTRRVYIFINSFGGISSSIWSNIIIFVTCYIVMTRRSLDIVKWYWLFFIIAITPALVVGTCGSIYLHHDIWSLLYLLSRTISIFLNITAFIIILHRVLYVDQQRSIDERRTNPVFVLAMRLLSYCIVQTITRIGASWYQFEYGFGLTYDSHHATALQTTAYLVESVLTPSAGIGYLIVFLNNQPSAWENAKKLLRKYLFFSNERRCSSFSEYTAVGSMSSKLPGVNEYISSPPYDSSFSTSLLQTESDTVGTSRLSSGSLFPLSHTDDEGLAMHIDQLHSVDSQRQTPLFSTES